MSDIKDDYQKVNVDFPKWMLDLIDKEVDRLGVNRQALIKMWLDEKLKQLERERKEA